ncbi:hypothetical protein ANAPC5_01394 [Anaplasma phagocytophilum]|nr:hypothetical protein ANAPC5_01394 [Anaplasma phagocytophilum]
MIQRYSERGCDEACIEKLDNAVRILFFYGFSQNLMSIARKINLNDVLTADFKLRKLLPFVGG